MQDRNVVILTRVDPNYLYRRNIFKFQSYFREVATVLNAGGPPDIARLKEVMLKHGLVPVMGN